MLTPLGKALRKLRIDRGWLLKEMADGIDVAPSFLSGVETGRKSIPDDFVGRIVQWAGLDKPAREDLEHAAAISRKEFKVGVNRDMSDSELHTAALLARFDQLPTEDREHIRQILVRRFG
jgi:HTH-type transcriptional regulator, competence development regulator